jgi:hypothetical protein
MSNELEQPIIKAVLTASTLWHGLASFSLIIKPRAWLSQFSAVKEIHPLAIDLCRGIGGLNTAFALLSGWALVRFANTKRVLGSDLCTLALARPHHNPSCDNSLLILYTLTGKPFAAGLGCCRLGEYDMGRPTQPVGGRRWPSCSSNWDTRRVFGLV